MTLSNYVLSIFIYSLAINFIYVYYSLQMALNEFTCTLNQPYNYTINYTSHIFLDSLLNNSYSQSSIIFIDSLDSYENNTRNI